jgi:hypothetical protein
LPLAKIGEVEPNVPGHRQPICHLHILLYAIALEHIIPARLRQGTRLALRLLQPQAGY